MTSYFLPLLLLSLDQVFFLDVRAQEPQVRIRSDCQSKCGNVPIPFPFGIGEGCYLSKSFEINCSLYGPPFLMITQDSVPLEVLEISTDKSTVRISHPVYQICGRGEDQNFYTNETANLEGTPFIFSQDANMFTGLGCSNIVYMSYGDPHTDRRYNFGGCFSVCEKNDEYKKRENNHSSCSGINCCQTVIASSLQLFNISISLYNSSSFQTLATSNGQLKDCRYAFLVEQNWAYDPLANLSTFTHVPVVLDWGVYASSLNQSTKDRNAICTNSTPITSYDFTEYDIYNCACNEGFEGNPYVENGCIDIDECKRHRDICGNSMYCENYNGTYACFAYPHKPNIITIGAGIGISFSSLFFFAMAWWIYIIIKRRKIMKRKKEFFKRNGGLLLEKQLISSSDKIDRCKLFSSDELDKATDGFNKNRILGQGGYGTVYKGMLADGQIIAVKKSKVIDEVNLEEFVNEVNILTQINHRNVVKLLGCCLESDVPLLVYEFIPNGTLYMYIHNPNKELEFTWDMRLRIATEVAEALSYLHSAASIPIYHRDIKSTNILLDEMLKAKVADFGTSKSFSMDQTHVTTKVIGTLGYLDPEYFQSHKLTEKSDVYSFGVVLIELLTGENPTRQGKCESLVSYFNVSMKEDHLYDILDAQVQSSGKKEEIITVASLAQRCLHLNGKKRPSMKEVAMVLEKTRTSQKGSKLDDEHHCEEIECGSEIIESWDTVTSSTNSTFAIIGPSTDQPLMRS